MFRTAVLGPIVATTPGLVRSCVACGAAATRPRCGGFGAGCLGSSLVPPPVDDPADRFVTFGFRPVARKV